MKRTRNQHGAENTGAKRQDSYARITDHIVKAIETGAATFQMPWHRESGSTARPKNALTDHVYSGVNVVSLWSAAADKGYDSPLWATYKQWNVLGGHVRKHQKGTPSVFYKSFSKTVHDKDTGNPRDEQFRFARTSWLFNLDQVDDYTPTAPVARDKSLVEIVEEADDFVSGIGADIRHGGDRAYYSPARDYVQMPDRDRFTGSSTRSATESYYAVLFHELTHYSGHKSRLNRTHADERRKESYAFEELIAELGGAYLCADHNITNEPRPDHAAYVSGWLAVLDRDKRAIFKAARKAQDAVDYLSSVSAPDF